MSSTVAGSFVPYRITVTVVAVQQVQGDSFASRLAATYTNRRRIDRTICPIGPSHDAARYTGSVAVIPSPPAASFTATAAPSSDSVQFTDSSTPGVGGVPIVSTVWQFGDPASGAFNSSTVANPTHVFTAAGSYQVSLTVTDANGLTATTTSAVTVSGTTGSGTTGSGTTGSGTTGSGTTGSGTAPSRAPTRVR